MQLDQALALAVRYRDIIEPTGILRHALEQAANVIHEEANKALRMVREQVYPESASPVSLHTLAIPAPALQAAERILPKVHELTPWALQAAIDNTPQ